jgi:hypothetical protein
VRNVIVPGIEFCRRFAEEAAELDDGVWSLDMLPEAEQVLRGPYGSVAQAHRDRDWLWNYGEKHGRYIWVVTSRAVARLAKERSDLHSIELTTDALTMEVVRLSVRGPNREWCDVTHRRNKVRR